MPADNETAAQRSGLRLGREQERRLRAWPTGRIRPKSVALGVLSLLAEVDALRAVQRPQVTRLQTEVARLTAQLATAQAERDAALAEATALRTVMTAAVEILDPVMTDGFEAAVQVNRAHRVLRRALAPGGAGEGP